MESIETGDLLLMLLDDDLFWQTHEQTDDKKKCGDTSNLTPMD